MPRMTKRGVLTAKVESTYNSDSSPGTSDVVRAEEVSIDLNRGAKMNERPAQRGTLGQLPHLYGGALGAIEFSVPIAGSGTAGTAPEVDALLRACGMAVTTVPSTSVAYAPTSDAQNHESCTIKYYEDGTLYVFTGCVGNVSVNAEAGAHGKLQFSMVGHISGPSDSALISGSFSTVSPPQIKGLSYTLDSYAGVIAALTADLQNTIAELPSVNGADGYGRMQITARDVMMTVNPEVELVATEDYVGNWRSGASQAVAFGTVGATAGNRWALAMPAAVVREIGKEERDGVAVYALTLGCAESSGDDEITLTFT
ncbi:MAG: phage tail tube protein [Gammaproteobacteria bacterium]